MARFLYRAYGLTIASPFSFPELRQEDADLSADANVVISESEVRIPEYDASLDSYVDMGSGEAFLLLRGTGACQVCHGREIRFQAAEGVSSKALRFFLMGAAFSMVLHQRGNLVLHASAVAAPEASGGGAIAFLGHSGQGKSTMATALFERGYRAVADDLVAVPFPEEGLASTPSVFSGFPFFKLRSPSVTGLYGDTSALPLRVTEAPGYLRHERSSLDRFQERPLPLRRLYVLTEAEEVGIGRLSPSEALMALVHHSYWVAHFSREQRAHHFSQCVQFQQCLPVFALRRPHDFAYMEQVIGEIEGDLESADEPA